MQDFRQKKYAKIQEDIYSRPEQLSPYAGVPVGVTPDVTYVVTVTICVLRVKDVGTAEVGGTAGSGAAGAGTGGTGAGGWESGRGGTPAGLPTDVGTPAGLDIPVDGP